MVVEVFTKAKVKEIPIPDALSFMVGSNTFRIMTAKDGDKRIVWNRFSIPELEAARVMFNSLVAEGMIPYKVGVDGRASADVMQEFDAFSEEVIFVPLQAICGG